MSSTDLIDRLDKVKLHLQAADGWTRFDQETIELVKRELKPGLARKWYRMKGEAWKN